MTNQHQHDIRVLSDYIEGLRTTGPEHQAGTSTVALCAAMSLCANLVANRVMEQSKHLEKEEGPSDPQTGTLLDLLKKAQEEIEHYKKLLAFLAEDYGYGLGYEIAGRKPIVGYPPNLAGEWAEGFIEAVGNAYRQRTRS